MSGQLYVSISRTGTQQGYSSCMLQLQEGSGGFKMHASGACQSRAQGKLTSHYLGYILAAPARHHAPDRALQQVQQVVVDPEPDQEDDGQQHHLQYMFT